MRHRLNGLAAATSRLALALGAALAAAGPVAANQSQVTGKPPPPLKTTAAPPAAPTPPAAKAEPAATAKAAPVDPAATAPTQPTAAAAPATPTVTAPPAAAAATPPPTATPAPPVAATPPAAQKAPVAAVSPPAPASTPAAAPAAAPTTPTTPPAAATAPATPPPIPAATADEKIGTAVRRALAALNPGLTAEERRDSDALQVFYAARNDEPLWVTTTGLNDKAKLVWAELARADDWGLRAGDYTPPPGATEPAATRDALVNAEVALSGTVLKYARDARGGRIADPATQITSYLDRTPQYRDPRAILDDLAAEDSPDATLRGLHPRHPQFERLRQRYLAMKKGEASAPEVVTIPPGPPLGPGQKNAQVPLLRERLGVAVPADADPTLFDPDLVAAVKAFQTERGLRADGWVGAGTRAAMNDVERPSAARLLANMEQWRWMPEDLGAFYVWSNIPEFMVRVVKAGKTIHEERIITGLLDKQTPVFSDEMETIVVHPRWIVPDSIKVRELYPSLARGGSYFQKQGLRMTQNGRLVDPTTVDWGSTDIRRFDIYQPPGGTNVLGLVKILFPNKHQVYMHDTPTKALFDEQSRTFSHGCMRVRNPVRLTEILLAEDKGWTPEQVAELIAAPTEENPITLDKHIPVHVTYFTAWIDDAGNEHFAKDVYGHEERISLALEGRFAEIARLPDHLAPVKYPTTRYADGNPFETFLNAFGGF